MPNAEEKKTSVELFFQEVDELRANPDVSEFSSVEHEPEAVKVLKAIPPKWEPDFVQKLYYELLRKGGLRPELKSVKDVHWPALIEAFKQVDAVEHSAIRRVQKLILWGEGGPGSLEKPRFLENLKFLLLANRYTNIPGLVKKRKAFEPFIEDEELLQLGRNAVRTVGFENLWGQELFPYWASVYLNFIEQGRESQAFLEEFLAENDDPGMRSRLFLTGQILRANKKDAFCKEWNERLRKTYPDEWLDVYQADS